MSKLTKNDRTAIQRTLWVFLLSLLGVVGLSGCVSAGGSTAPVAVTCPATGLVTATTPTVAILGQTGAGISYYTSTRSTATGEKSSDLSTAISGSETIKADVIVNGVGANNTAPDLLATKVLTGDGHNNLLRKNNLTCKETAVTGAVNTTLAKGTDPKPVDVFDALTTLQGNLTGTASKQPVNVVLFTSLLNTAAPVDLADPNVLANPIAAINTLAGQRLLPDCTNWRVYAVGGEQATPPLTDVESAQLREFWREFFNRCHGTLVTWTDHLSQFPIDTGAITAADTAQIQIRQTPKAFIATLDGDILFGPGSPVLRPAAVGQLNQLLLLCNKYTGRIQVDGFTDVGGDENANYQLSVARAHGVAAWLVAHGVSDSRVSSAGQGSRNPVYANPTTDAQHQANRRVVATIYTS